MTTLIIVRHAEVEGIEPPVFHGRIVLPLTARGIRQAELTREVLHASWAIDAIYCSPLTRCVRTADILNEALQLNPVPHQGLTDIDYGAWTNLAMDDVAQRWPRQLEQWRHYPQHCSVPGGESLQEVAARVVATLSHLLVAHASGTVALVLHDSVIRVLLCHLLGLPLSSYWLFDPSLCGISVVTHHDNRFTAHSINETQHLVNA
jgi:probable phosphoglycerate mutase